MLNRKVMEFWVGMFVVVALLSLVFLAFKVGNLGTSDVGKSYRIKAVFGNIGQLKPKAPVKQSGVLIGRVMAITLNGDYKAEVHIEINENFKIPVDSKLSIRTAGLLGSQYIAVHTGVIDDFLANGDVVDEANTQSAMVLEDLIGRFFVNKADEASK